jgi:hypothetical protein
VCVCVCDCNVKAQRSVQCTVRTAPIVTQICHNPPLHNITTENRNTSKLQQVMILRSIRGFYGHKILTEGVFVTKLSGDTGVSV